MKRFRKQFLIFLCIIMAVTLLSACSEKEDSDNVSEPSKTDETAGTNNVSTNIISNGEFSVTVPDSWEGKYEVITDDESIQLYQKAAYENFGGGHLCTFAVFHDDSYKELPDYKVLISGGETDADTNETLSKFTYVVMYPTDVQADIEDKESAGEYFEMFEQLPQVVGSFKLEE